MEDNVVYLRRSKRFTLDEARSLLPQVKALTDEAMENVEPLVMKIQDAPTEDEKARWAGMLQDRIDQWTDEIVKLGIVPKGLWLVDFDSGHGFYCWHHGDDDLAFCHGYDEGFSSRVPIS